jgi:hypothetical protein
LHVCSETRHQGLKHYTKVLQRPLSADHVPNNIIYMILEIDTLCVLPRRLQPTDRESYTSLRNYVFKNSNEARKSSQLLND